MLFLTRFQQSEVICVDLYVGFSQLEFMTEGTNRRQTHSACCSRLFLTVTYVTTCEIGTASVQAGPTTGGLAERVGVIEAAPLVQGALVVKASLLEHHCANTQPIIKDKVAVIDLQPQVVIFQSVSVGELLLPPGVNLVVNGSRLAQTGRPAEHLHVTIGDSQTIGGEAGGPQVEHSEATLSRCQTTQDQQQKRNRGGHVFTGGCG